jgi:16S rRNA (guanine966-N2)-methyltransferase
MLIVYTRPFKRIFLLPSTWRHRTVPLAQRMRVIAGSAGGVRLKIPPHDLRPSMDKVREAAFSALGELVFDARVLDLFAGSGAYGIEALSRGAAEAVFVDSHPRSIEAIQFNLAKAKLAGRVVWDDVFRFLGKRGERYRIVFADPPYAKEVGDRDFAEELLSNESLAGLVEPGGLVVLERAPAEIPGSSPYWEVTRAKKYGATELLFFIHKEPPR